MATQGPLFPGTIANLSNAGTAEDKDAWLNPGNVVSDNGTEATIVAATYDSPDISQILVVSNFGFSSVSGTVDGITVEIDRRSIIASSGKDFRVQLGTGTAFANLVGTNKGIPATIWPTTSTVATYGGAADTWSASLTAAQVASSGFAVFLSCQANIANADVGVDFIRVTVTYTPPAGISSTATWEQAAGSWDAVADERISSTATVEQATAGWMATAGERLAATAEFSQASANWDATAVHTESGISSTGTWIQSAAGWSSEADEHIASSAAFTQSASWASIADERMAISAAFAQGPSSWAASAETPIQMSAAWVQVNGWQAVLVTEGSDPISVRFRRMGFRVGRGLKITRLGQMK